MKASDNKFPLIRFATGAAPDAPPAGQIIVYTKGDGKLYRKGADDVEHAIGEGGAGLPPVWGGVTGTLADQTDLVAALSGKADANHNHDGVYVKPSALGSMAAANDAPTDGKDYVRKDGAWAEAAAPGSSGPATTHTTAPTDGVSTDNPYLYYNQDTGEAKMYLRTAAGVYIEMSSVQVDPGTPPEEIDPNAMLLGLNTTWISDWANDGAVANLMHSAHPPARVFGTGSWSCLRGEVTTDNPTTVTRIALRHVDDLRAMALYTTGDIHANFTVVNPDGLKVMIGGWGTGDSGASADGVDGWTTATQFTFNDIDPSDGLPWTSSVGIFVEGNLTAVNGRLAVILPGHLASWQAGNEWRDAALDFYTKSKTKVLRFLDFTNGSNNPETEWSERALKNSVQWRIGWPSYHEPTVPWEVCFDLCNRIGADAWINVPYRATQAYVEGLAALAKATLNAGRKIYIEHGNETWNWGAAWAAGGYWCRFLDFTKRKANADFANQRWILPSHGLTDGAELRIFNSVENTNDMASGGDYYEYYISGAKYVKVIDADHFELHRIETLDWRYDIPEPVKTIIFVDTNEVGKVQNLDVNFGLLSKRDWDIFAAEFAGQEARCVNVLASQAANTSVTSSRVSDPGVAGSADFVAVAPYFSGAWFAMELVPSSGGIQPNWWAWDSMPNVTIGVYDATATPTTAEVLDGAGAGFIHREVLNFVVPDDGQVLPDVGGGVKGFNSSGVAVSGLNNDTEYKVIAVGSVVGTDFRIEGRATPKASDAVRVTVTDSFANQAVRNRVEIQTNQVSWVQGTKTAAGNIPVITYEGGYHSAEIAPATVATWFDGYLKSSEFATLMTYYLHVMQAQGLKLFAWYAAVRTGLWGLADKFVDVDTDNRIGAFKALGGYVNPATAVTTVAPELADIVSAPGSYPAVLGSFSDATLTYSIVGGNQQGHFAMSGADVTLVNSDGVDYGSITSGSLLVEASNGSTSEFFAIPYVLGYSDYATDATYLWSAADSSDITKMTPRVGSSVATAGDVSGTDPVVASGSKWKVPFVNNYSGYFNTDGVPTTNCILLCTTLDVSATGPAPWSPCVRFGASSTTSSIGTGSGGVAFAMTSHGSEVKPATSEKAVYWMLLAPGEGKIYFGKNQAVLGTKDDYVPGASVMKDFRVGGEAGSSAGKYFDLYDVLVVARPSLSLSAVQAIVAKVQALHSIA